jgi:hypothetical protein
VGRIASHDYHASCLSQWNQPLITMMALFPRPLLPALIHEPLTQTQLKNLRSRVAVPQPSMRLGLTRRALTNPKLIQSSDEGHFLSHGDSSWRLLMPLEFGAGGGGGGLVFNSEAVDHHQTIRGGNHGVCHCTTKLCVMCWIPHT